MTLGPNPATAQRFDISDTNADIDGVLLALEERGFILERLGSVERRSPEAEKLRLSELAALERATEEVLSGAISLDSVQWIRACLEDKVGNSALQWFSHAGAFVRPLSYESVFILEEGGLSVEAPPPELPINPEIRVVREALGGRIAGATIRPYDATSDALSRDDRATFETFLQNKGMTVTPIMAELDLSNLAMDEERRFSQGRGGGIELSIAAVVRQLVERGVTEMYHATGLFTYEALKGAWITAGSRGGEDFGQAGGFFMAGTLDWEDVYRGLANYIQDDPFHDICRREEVALSQHAHELGERGVLLKIDLRGYLEFLQSNTVSGFIVTGDVARAICPPPPEFIRPIAVFEYPQR
jgi:hypothetical protein